MLDFIYVAQHRSGFGVGRHSRLGRKPLHLHTHTRSFQPKNRANMAIFKKCTQMLAVYGQAENISFQGGTVVHAPTLP